MIVSRFSFLKLDFRSMNLRSIVVNLLKILRSLLGLSLIKIKIHIYVYIYIILYIVYMLHKLKLYLLL